jgi:cation diffusion facilitator family transporter
MTSIQIDPAAEKEKASAALSSVIAAIFLTGFKIVVGMMTNSLGILAEAAHSTLDLVAAMVTYIAVRASGRPPDHEHQYGHGKIENISALFETFLLLVTCAWIIYESIQRLFFKEVQVEASFWAFTVMFVSIIIDFSRSRILYRAARKHNSHALEADALHFSTDIWSSAVVILGLVGVRLATAFPQLAFLHKADAIAALVVALIVIYVSIELGGRNIQALLDRSPRGLDEKIKETVSQVPGVQSCHQVRIRPSGPNTFIDIHIVMDPSKHLDEVHQIMDDVESAIQVIAPKADITVHPEPETDG